MESSGNIITQLPGIIDSDWSVAAISCQIFLNNGRCPGKHGITDPENHISVQSLKKPRTKKSLQLIQKNS